MTVVLGYRNQRYDDTVPLYCLTGTPLVYNRVTGKFVDHASLVAAMAADSYTAGANEIALPPYSWQQNHRIFGPYGEGAGGAIPGSNTVSNGESWTGAAGATPPTGWTDGGTAAYAVANGILTMTNAAAGDDTLTQTQTVVDATDYVAYVRIFRTVGVATVTVDGGTPVTVTGQGTVRVPFTASGVTADIVLTVSGVGVLEVDYARCILAADEV